MSRVSVKVQPSEEIDEAVIGLDHALGFFFEVYKGDETVVELTSTSGPRLLEKIAECGIVLDKNDLRTRAAARDVMFDIDPGFGWPEKEESHEGA